MARRAPVEKGRAIELLAKAVGAAGTTVNTLDPRALAAMVSGQLGAMYSAPPESMENALIEQGMEWTRPFAPGRPLNPYEGYSGAPRLWNFTPGVNVQLTPRYGRVSFSTLTSLVSNYDVAQIAGRHLINDLRSMKLDFRPQPHVKENIDDQLAIAREFFKKPDKKMTFRNWFAKWAFDVIHYDAGCLFKHRTRDGKLWSLTVVDGRTMIPLIDYYGDSPRNFDEDGNELPDIPPSYLQIIQGIPWKWFDANDIVYEPINPINGSNYGVAPIEQVILNANTDLRFQWHFLQFFTEGSIPKGFMEAPPDMSQPDQLVEWQTTWEALVQGDQAKKWQMRWIPYGSKFTGIGAEKFDENFPLYLLRRTLASYGVTPADLGFTEDVNRATSETQADVQFRIGLMPLVNYFQDQLDDILQNELGLQVEARFDTGQEVKDRLAEAQVHDIAIRNGAESVDEYRRDVLGYPVDPSNLTPRFFSTPRAGAVPLKAIIEVAGPIDMDTGAPIAGSVEPLELMPASDGTDDGDDTDETSDADQERAQRKAAKAQLDATIADTLSDTAGVGVGGAPPPPALMAKELGRTLHQWQVNARRRVREGKEPRIFADATIPTEIQEAVWARLAKAKSADEVDFAFELVKSGKVPGPPNWPGHSYTDALVTHYTPLVAKARGLDFSGIDEAVAQAVNGYHEGHDAHAIAQQAIAAHIRIDADHLGDVLRLLYGDSWVAGSHVGIVAMQSKTLAKADDDSEDEDTTTPFRVGGGVEQIVSGIDWDNWQPGWGDAAAKDANGGLRALLDAAGITIRGMDDTALSIMGNLLADGLTSGAGIDAIARTLRGETVNPARATVIARTEVARAMSQANMDVYTSNDVEQVELLVFDPCPECEEIESGNPWAVGDTEDVPIHPSCRCAWSPIISGIDTSIQQDEG